MARYNSAESAAWSAGRAAGLKKAGIGTNPHKTDASLSDAWDAGYQIGRDDAEYRDGSWKRNVA